MAQSVFSAGYLFAIPSGATPTPLVFGALQDVSVDFQFDNKQLYGQGQFPIEQARGKGKIDIKATIGRIDATLFNNIFFNAASATGETLSSVNEAGTVATAAVTVANSATFATDLGVYNPATGKFYTRVASAPAIGQYSVAAGTYTFNTTENGTALKFFYTYNSSSTGVTLTGINPQMGSGPIFSVKLVNVYKAKSLSLTFPAVQSPKLQFPLKLDDFTQPQIEMSAQDDGLGNVFTWSNTNI